MYRHRYVSHIKRFPSEIRNKGTYLETETFLCDFFAAKREGIYLFPVKYFESNFARMRSFKQKGVNVSVMYLAFFLYALFSEMCKHFRKVFMLSNAVFYPERCERFWEVLASFSNTIFYPKMCDHFRKVFHAFCTPKMTFIDRKVQAFLASISNRCAYKGMDVCVHR